MRAFLRSLDEKVWQAVEIGWTKRTEAPVDWDDAKIKAANFNNRALNALFSAVTNEEFKKLMKNSIGKGFDKNRRQSSSSQFKGQDKGRKDAKEGGQYIVPAGPKCFGHQGFGHMKHECPTYLKSIGDRRAHV